MAQIKSFKTEDIIVISLSGAMLGGNADIKFRNLVVKLTSTGSKKIIIDLSRLRKINSTGLGTLVGSTVAARNNDGLLVLAAPRRKILSLMKIAATRHLWRIYESVEEAIDTLSQVNII